MTFSPLHVYTLNVNNENFWNRSKYSLGEICIIYLFCIFSGRESNKKNIAVWFWIRCDLCCQIIAVCQKNLFFCTDFLLANTELNHIWVDCVKMFLHASVNIYSKITLYFFIILTPSWQSNIINPFHIFTTKKVVIIKFLKEFSK